MRTHFYVLIILAVVGFWCGEELVKIHIDTLYANGGDTGICAGDGFSCSEVARSGYSQLFGLPIAVLGQAYYGVVLLVAGLLRFMPDRFKGLWDGLVASAALGTAYSIFLGVASKVVIGKLCPFCMGLYAVNLAVLITAWHGHPDGGKAAFARLFKLPTTTGFWIMVAGMSVFTLGAQGAYAHRAGKAAEAYQARKAAALKAPQQRVEIDVADLPGRGPADAPVVIIEYSDFECPFCRILAKSLKQVQAEHPTLLRYYFKHSPMDDACNPNIRRKFHEDACRAAYAAECARSQGKFWEMHDVMFDNNKRLGEADLVGYASDLGLDPERFKACLHDPATDTAIKRDIAEGKAKGVDGTPTWFINGWRVVGARRPGDMAGIVERAAKNAKDGVDKSPE